MHVTDANFLENLLTFNHFLGTMILGTVGVLIGLVAGANGMPTTKLHGCFRYGTTLQCSILKFRSFIFPNVAEDRNLKSIVFGSSHPLTLNCDKLPGNILIFVCKCLSRILKFFAFITNFHE